jgi:hypothetical protein
LGNAKNECIEVLVEWEGVSVLMGRWVLLILNSAPSNLKWLRCWSAKSFNCSVYSTVAANIPRNLTSPPAPNCCKTCCWLTHISFLSNSFSLHWRKIVQYTSSFEAIVLKLTWNYYQPACYPFKSYNQYIPLLNVSSEQNPLTAISFTNYYSEV